MYQTEEEYYVALERRETAEDRAIDEDYRRYHAKKDEITDRDEKIKILCPYCNAIEDAIVKHKEPFDDITHKCSHCSHWIMESEWEIYDPDGNRGSYLRNEANK